MVRVSLLTLSRNEVIERENEFLTFEKWQDADHYCNTKNCVETEEYFESKYIWEYI